MPPQTTASSSGSSPVKGKKSTTIASSSTTSEPIQEELIQVDDKLYSAQKLASIHPGGDDIISFWNIYSELQLHVVLTGELFVRAFAGKDATDAFLSYHRRNFPHASAQGLWVYNCVTIILYLHLANTAILTIFCS